MKTIAEVIQLSTTFLEERNVDRPRRSAEDLLSSVLNLKRMELYLQFDRPVIEEELALLRGLLKRRGRGEPIEYVIGEIEFFGCQIRVDARVLIPRPETEILVEFIVKRLKERAPQSLWDLCTGSGCIGIALKKALPNLVVTLSDVSADALALASENARANQVDVTLLKGDLLAPFSGQTVDVVVSNPPYISTTEFFTLDSSVRDFEPKVALVGGDRGTEFYERLNRDLPHYLNPKGKVFLEIGSGQGESLKQIFSKGPWVQFELLKDWAGQDRFIFLEKQ